MTGGRHENAAGGVRCAWSDHACGRRGADRVSDGDPFCGRHHNRTIGLSARLPGRGGATHVAVVSFGATRITDVAALRLIVSTFVVLHLASGILNVVYMALTKANGTMVANTVLRFTVVAVFLVVWWAARPH